MSFLKSLFGRKSESSTAAPAVAKETEHKGFVIRATPYLQNGQYQTAGLITKSVDGAEKEHRFVRADRFPSLDEAADIALAKGRQIVDEQGERMFG